MLIRKETQQDYGEVYDVIKKAFQASEHADGNEQDLVCKLRKSDAFIPELSLVATENNMIVGHIMFTKALINVNTVIALAPLSVLPEYQKIGVGSALIEQGHRIARELGYNLSVVLGSQKYYSKFGYIPASRYGISAPFDVPDENFMALTLNNCSTMYNGVVKYANEFFEL